ncbi:unnamed protein product [Heligmosomoides polygyrus]|uniref:RING-type domain-containing protein n=1 Tax=Heligmosomoides polygyrus TaxID=6339 RepID=A0A3P8D2H9_HELPZ|nr:unnamed protein product [Heligmosomoides polygyrus]
MCPAPACSGTRSSDVIVDEMAGNTTTQISFGSHTLSVLDLDERQRCEARRGAFLCVNTARMRLINCRHRICYDCLSQKIDQDIVNRMRFCTATSILAIRSSHESLPSANYLPCEPRTFPIFPYYLISLHSCFRYHVNSLIKSSTIGLLKRLIYSSCS